MPARLLYLAVALIIGVLLLRWFVSLPPAKVARFLKRGALFALAAGLIVLAATGRLHWLFVLVGAMVPFLQRLLRLPFALPLLKKLIDSWRWQRASKGAASGRVSEVETAFLRMTLDHDSGVMNGIVLSGPYQGQTLDSLNLAQLTALLSSLQTQDQQSAALLEAYLDRVHGAAWRSTDGRRPDDSTARQGGQADSRMTEAEAYQVLGLEPGATEQEIIDAHRRLMQKFHPDRGGSNYLAAKLNAAKDALLGRR